MNGSKRRQSGSRTGILASVLVVCLTATVFLSANANAATTRIKAADSDATWIGKSLDAALLRPLGAVRLAAGSLIFMPVTFFNGLGQSSVAALNVVGLASEPNWGIFAETLDIFVLNPSRFLFIRPLGEDLYGDN